MDWRDAVARISVTENGREVGWGTGFLASPCHVLMVLHVVGCAVADDAVPHGTIHLMFEFPASGKHTHTTQAVVVCSDADDDWALLKCIAPPRTDPIALASRNQPREEWHSLGYPKVIDGRQFQMDGYIVATHAQIPSAKNPAIQLFSQQLAAGKGIDIQGFSGGSDRCRATHGRTIGQPKFVAVGVMRWVIVEAIFDSHDVDGNQPAMAGTAFAAPLGPILDAAPKLLNDYDSVTNRLRRAPLQLGVRTGGWLWEAFTWRIPVGLVAIVIVPFFAFAVWNWPEGWVPRLDYGTAATEFQPGVAREAFSMPVQTDANQIIQQKNSPDAWKVWTREMEPGPKREYLVVEWPEFDAAYDQFDRDVTVHYQDDQGTPHAAVIESGAAFLVDRSRFEADGIPLPCYRQQLLFIDAANRFNATERRPAVAH